VVTGAGDQSEVTVLLVEDDPEIAALYALRLRMDGITVHIARDATTAQIIFRRARPSVVCMDHRLPDGPGVPLAREFIRTGTPVIILTNDQEGFENPPPGVARALLKMRTPPAALVATIRDVAATGSSRVSANGTTRQAS
jgi:DNA-binding NtrC family response regulator